MTGWCAIIKDGVVEGRCQDLDYIIEAQCILEKPVILKVIKGGIFCTGACDKLTNREMTYKEFFERGKSEPIIATIIQDCLLAAIKIILRGKMLGHGNHDVGKLMLSTLGSITKISAGMILTGQEDITADYVAEQIEYYNKGASGGINHDN